MVACAAALKLWRARAATLLLLVTAAVVVVPSRADQGGWSSPARATWYNDNGDGSCHFAPADVPYYYAAWPPGQAGAPACGACFEVSCVDSTFQDGYGATLDRTNACYDISKSVVVKIVDSCPCIQNDNYYSNKRWCCGDMRHMDLGHAAFSQLASDSVGVIGIQYRQADCSRLGVSSIGTAPSPSAPASPSNNVGTWAGQPGMALASPPSVWSPPSNAWSPPSNAWSPPSNAGSPPSNAWSPPSNAWSPPNGWFGQPPSQQAGSSFPSPPQEQQQQPGWSPIINWGR